MNRNYVALVLGSKTRFDPEIVSNFLEIKATRVWHRKPDLVVFGEDRVSQVEWILEETFDESVLIGDAIAIFFQNHSFQNDRLIKISEELELSVSIVARVFSDEVENSLDLSPELAGKIHRIGANLLYTCGPS